MIEDRQAILITGASAGIGAAFAKRYAAKGFDLVLCARRLDRLEATCDTLSKAHKITAIALAEDLADPDAPARLIARVTAAGITLGGLVNNAGFGPRGFYVSSLWSTHADFIQVMLTAPCHLAHLALPQMLERGHGRIINIGSLAALLPSSAELGLYGAAKSFLIKFSEVLNLQCRGTGVHVTAVCPGFTRTEFHEVAGLEDIAKLPSFLWMNADSVAAQGIGAVERNDAVYIPGGINKVIAGLVKYLPHSLAKTLFASSEHLTN
jgi:uncharacterized protein